MGLLRCHHRARPCSGSRRAPGKRGSDAQGLGRSRGGLSAKIHLICDALGNPVRLLAGPRQQGDVLRAAELIEGLACGHVIADRADDAEHFHDTVLDAEAIPMVPPRPNRCRPHAFDHILYKERNLVERCFAKLKQFRRVATRYDKLLGKSTGFATVAAICIWLR
ncbi:IS5 family transposase [Methylobacterium dankookense]|uniref:IS5 family transposase ISCc1 n=1 Tax=Methylobacterium dankookense TaxID=560405 RepID=A0A564G8K6_9HYPH|nr:IS5 family transposase [Methylobacterium dankookense]GJD59035.1 IS5 family transposase ISCc1 [Methylobacterium dankookense]VUF15871.1 hypothetical protein MTDSW087_05619 [Methylobacterium dankookense]